MADKKQSISNEILRQNDSIDRKFESKIPSKFVVRPIDWSDVGLTEKEVHALLYEDDEKSSDPRAMSALLEDGKENQWERSIGKINWSDIGMTEKEVMDLMADDESCKKDFPINGSVDCGAKNFTFVSEASQSFTVNNDNEKESLMPSAYDFKISEGESIIDGDDASTRCQLQVMMLSNEMAQVTEVAFKNEGPAECKKTVTVRRKKNCKDIHRKKEIYSKTQISVSNCKTISINTVSINESNVLKDNDSYEKTVNISTDSDISYWSDKIVKASTDHNTKMTAGNSCKATEMDSMKPRRGLKGVIGNCLKRKFQSRDQGNSFDGISPRKTRRLEKIEELNISDTAYTKKPKRKCVFLSLGTKDVNPTTKFISPNQKRRRWRS